VAKPERFSKPKLSEPLLRQAAADGMTATEAATLFGVTVEAICYWRQKGIAFRRGSNRRRLPWLERHVNYSGDNCLTWPFGRDKGGYGKFPHAGRCGAAHRQMCVLAHGEAPFPKALALHSCGNGHLGCVNPRHLRWGTYQDNIADARRHSALRDARERLAELPA
jgi:hypothetical protein